MLNKFKTFNFKKKIPTDNNLFKEKQTNLFFYFFLLILKFMFKFY